MFETDVSECSSRSYFYTNPFGALYRTMNEVHFKSDPVVRV